MEKDFKSTVTRYEKTLTISPYNYLNDIYFNEAIETVSLTETRNIKTYK
jgi:hypothetical protein